jgi:hypothetical protein
MSTTPLISQSEYAKRRNVSREAVRQAVAAGRVSLINGKIDPDVADIQWVKNTKNPKAAFAQPKPLLDFSAGAPTQPAAAPSQPLPDSAITQVVYDLQLSRAKREHHEANIAEMRERQKAGELVELAQVHLAYTTLAAQLRAALERIPDKIAPRLAAETDEHTIHTLLLAELDQAMLDMATTAAQLPAKLQEASNND